MNTIYMQHYNIWDIHTHTHKYTKHLAITLSSSRQHPCEIGVYMVDIINPNLEANKPHVPKTLSELLLS